MARGVRKGTIGLFSRLRESLSGVMAKGRQHFTIMLIPHSEKKIFNLKISIFALVFYGAVLATVVTGFLVMTMFFADMQEKRVTSEQIAKEAQAKLDIFGEEINTLGQVSQLHEAAFSSLLDVIGASQSSQTLEQDARGDLAAFLNTQQLGQGASREVGSLVALRAYLEGSLAPMGEVTNVLNSQKKLLVDIPTLWPLKGVRGRITSYHGTQEHPFTGAWYFHKGIDIAQASGTPIVATANGKVSKVDFDANGYGHYAVLTHEYGFTTLFGHMSRVYVTKGQSVTRGQVIGAVGSTGQSTGPHVHYEVHIGTTLVNPLEYLNISSDIVDQGNGAEGRGF